MANLSSSKIVKMFAGVVELKRPPKLERITNRGRVYWRVILGRKANGQSVRKSLPAKSEDEARAMFAEIYSRVEAGDLDLAESVFSTTADLEFKTAKRKLSPYAATVEEAVEFFIKHHKPKSGIVTLNEALEIWVTHVERDGGSETYIRRMRDTYAGPFAKVYGHLFLRDLNHEIADTYIHEVKKNLSPASKAETITKLTVFLNKLASLGYYTKELNPFAELTKPKARPGRDREKDRLIPPEMMAEILEFALSSEKPSYLELGVGFVLEAFCAVRRTEVERLSREDLQGVGEILEEKNEDEFFGFDREGIFIRIPQLQAKWGHKRNFRMPENAVVWLRHFIAKGWKTKGPFFTHENTGAPLLPEGVSTRRTRFFRAFKEKCERDGQDFPDYLQNGLRVSCASYGAKVFGVSKICEMLGHKRPEATFWKHYREDCLERDARRFFSLIPRSETGRREAREALEFAIQQGVRENPPEVD